MKIEKRNVYFIVLGIGAGMLLTSLLNIINPKTEFVQYSDEQIIQRASELGMASIKDIINENENNKEDDSKIESIPEENDNANNVSGAEGDKLQYQEPEVVSVIINRGDTSEEIVDKLYEQGIISDKEALSNFIIEKNVQHKFNYGKFEIVKEIDFESLIGMLTKN